MRKRQAATGLLCGVLAAGMLACNAQADGSELKGPGNVTIKRLGYNVAFDPNADVMADVIKDTTGYDAEYYVLPAENTDEKLVMEVAGGADYDCIQVSPNQFQILMSQGALLGLNDLLDTYGQDIKNGMSEDTWRAASDSDGTIYGIPYKYPYDQEVQGFMACRWDLMQAAGITEIPKTIDEFHDCLVKLKDYYGDQYIIFSGPYLSGSEGNGTWVVPESLACAFGIYSDWMVDEDGSVYYMTEADGFKDMVEFLSKCNEEGLIDPDWVVNSASTVCEKFSGGKSIITSINRNGLGTTVPAMLETLGISMDDLNYIGALKGSDGTCKFMKTEAVNQYTVILKSSENAADVVNWINLKEQNQLFINIGEEGVHFNYAEDGSIEPINPIFADERGNSYWYIDSTNEEEFKKEWPARVRKSEAQWAGFEAVTIKANEETPEIFVDNPFAFKPATEKYSKYNTALSNSLNDFILQIISGTKSYDDLETFQSDFEAKGGEEVRTELQDWYQSFYGNK
ncbi:MAG: extracellular solute-binding protein [Lachnospiraceae bacterium]|nr:extracellular solute-binding protein [Lachnospiraceae bacterium]